MVLLIAWLGGFTVFHVAGALIHLLLVLAVISLILHFVMGLLYAGKFTLYGSPKIARVALLGLIDGAGGKTGAPDHRSSTQLAHR